MPYESRIPQIVVEMEARLKAAEEETARRDRATAHPTPDHGRARGRHAGMGRAARAGHPLGRDESRVSIKFENQGEEGLIRRALLHDGLASYGPTR